MVALGILGGGMLALAGYGAGVCCLLYRRKRVCQLHALERLFSRIRDEIEYRGLPLDEILELLREDSALADLHLEACRDLHCMQLPAELTPEQKSCFHSALREAGCKTCEESVRSLAYYQNAALAFLQEETAQLKNAERSYRQLGLCMGLLAALILI